ncbi:uncharacterized protein LY89DRAFT_318706 [Mollisia scopiformis]|uniref:Myb-like DNA-binding domain-containing protein n=1 Tax=Mollisia scopiformis TaxID=149040 RepID=A0A132BB33_MOLSC|nr:uncharacterized protein LY89DRAFT_318706 [Mollisia scopiformis]KUJ09054.1 hypothetical protein LY89DRAFT_318706 [Mollisia scopiformis]
MPSDTAIQELLYAILKQKCLKDIDWNLVAADPILTQTITNGHAARMRYSRFKKQIERAHRASHPAPAPRPRNTTTGPKRSRVEKNESPKKVKRGSNAKAEIEHDEEESSREGTVDSTADVHPSMLVKRERGHHQAQIPQAEPGRESLMTPLASTPRYCMERSVSPSPSNNHQNPDNSFSDFATSFDAGLGANHLFGEVPFPSLGLEIGMGGVMGTGSFESFSNPSYWEQSQGLGNSQSQEVVERGVVKMEPRWGEEYRHV